MDVLAAILEAGLQGIVVGPICDPEAVAALHAAGVGAQVELGLGNRGPLPSIAPQSPLRVFGTVAALDNGTYVITGPTYTGQTCCRVRAALIDTGAARILVSEQPHEPWDLAVFTSSGIDSASARVRILKSRTYCRSVFETIARAVIEFASRCVTIMGHGLLQFKNISRQIFAFDHGSAWNMR